MCLEHQVQWDKVESWYAPETTLSKFHRGMRGSSIAYSKSRSRLYVACDPMAAAAFLEPEVDPKSAPVGD